MVNEVSNSEVRRNDEKDPDGNENDCICTRLRLYSIPEE
jgi:hypothetical protein